MEFSAATALAKSKRGGGGAAVHSADNLNYSLTISSIMKLIEAETNDGNRSVQYTIPWYVLDGVSADRPLLTSQVQKQLRKLGFIVNREEFTLFIDWDLDLYRREEELRHQHRAAADRALREQHVNFAWSAEEALPAREPVQVFPRATGARGNQANARAARERKTVPAATPAPMGRGGRPKPSMAEMRRVMNTNKQKKAAKNK